MILRSITALYIFIILPEIIHAQPPSNPVKFIGAMKNVMWKGELQGTVSLDTLNQSGLYAVGPVEFLKGEILVWDGTTYTSYAAGLDSMKVVRDEKIKAPFLVYSNVQDFKELTLPDSLVSIHDIENFLDHVLHGFQYPAAFKIQGIAVQATIHIMDVPGGTKINSPEEAHQFRKYYQLKNDEVDVIGFFSREHQGVFTHHDSFLHMHLVNKTRSSMGHLDSIQFKKGSVRIFLAKN